MNKYLVLIQHLANQLEDKSLGAICEVRRQLRDESPGLLPIFEEALNYEEGAGA